jgi:hypothetical protein
VPTARKLLLGWERASNRHNCRKFLQQGLLRHKDFWIFSRCVKCTGTPFLLGLNHFFLVPVNSWNSWTRINRKMRQILSENAHIKSVVELDLWLAGSRFFLLPGYVFFFKEIAAKVRQLYDIICLVVWVRHLLIFLPIISPRPSSPWRKMVFLCPTLPDRSNIFRSSYGLIW